MKRAGIIGGIGPESTIDYYKSIINGFKEDFNASGFPELIIDSLDLRYIVGLASAGEWELMTEIISERFNRLKSCGADFGVIASNTPHRVFNEISSKTDLPLISIVTETCSHIRTLGLKRLLLLGTGFTMRASFYRDELSLSGVEVFVPDENEINYIQHKLMTEIELGIIKTDTKQDLIKIIDRAVSSHDVEGVIMGCTELPGIIGENDIRIEYIDTMRIHIAGIINKIREI